LRLTAVRASTITLQSSLGGAVVASRSLPDPLIGDLIGAAASAGRVQVFKGAAVSLFPVVRR
jgi:hypothetical protein